MILRCTVTSQVLWKCEALRVIEDGERRRSRGAWWRATPPALPPRAPPLHSRHELLDAIIPLARLDIQRGRCPRLCSHGNVPAPTLKEIEFHIIREIFRLSNPELLAVWRSPAWSADTKSPHSPPHFETSRYRAVCAASPYESARVDSLCGSRSPATRESPPSGTLRSCQNR